jgi:hypothetical protein
MFTAHRSKIYLLLSFASEETALAAIFISRFYRLLTHPYVWGLHC